MDTNNIIVVCTVCIVEYELVHCTYESSCMFVIYSLVLSIRCMYAYQSYELRTVSILHHCRNNRVLYSMYSYTPKAPAILLLLTLLPLVCDVIENS